MEFKEYYVFDLASWTNGIACKDEDFCKEGAIPIIKIAELKNGITEQTKYTNKIFDEKVSLKKGDILFSWSGNPWTSIDIFKYTHDNGWLNQHIFKIIPNEMIVDKDYFFYLMKYHMKQFMKIASEKQTTGLGHVTVKDLKAFKTKICDYENQIRVKNILGNIDKKIELNNQMNENLLRLGDIIYRETFVKEGLQKGWKICKLKDVAHNFDSKRRPMSSRERERRKGIYPYYGATSIIDYVDDYIFDGIYLLMGEDGTVVTSEGKPVLQYIWGKNWINNHAHVLSGSTISTEHLMFALRNCNVRDIITGAVQPKINQENMNSIKIVIADPKTNIEFEKIIDMLMKQYKNNIEQNQRLEKIRDMLLPKLMNGEIDLDKIEI